ncbi:MAG: RNA-binding protein [Parvibaculum sp.]|nr:RNA-binding protein [Parvibaculum sp.]
MTDSAKKPKRPRDTNQLAKLIADIATGEKEDAPEPQESSMAKLGREGGLKGGKARAASLTPEQRREIAQKAAKSRWSKD